jgi:hypothetical protein
MKAVIHRASTAVGGEVNTGCASMLIWGQWLSGYIFKRT